MRIKTHTRANQDLLGKPVIVKDGKKAIVELTFTEKMSVDEKGLIHGGFTFGAADYAAMLAVNDPYVVLGKADVKFLAPVKIGEKITANAEVIEVDGKKRIVEVTVFSKDTTILSGEMICFVLDKHVFD
jgi:acyl-coenzyme A thioesterase PaaI-like protein